MVGRNGIRHKRDRRNEIKTGVDDNGIVTAPNTEEKNNDVVRRERRSLLIKEITILSARISDLERRSKENADTARQIESGEKELDFDFSEDNKKPQDASTNESVYTGLDQDTFTLMITSRPWTKTWWLGMSIFILQSFLLIFSFVGIVETKSTPFSVPFDVSGSVRITQILAIIVLLGTAKDFVSPIKDIIMLWITNYDQWTHVISCITPDDTFLPDWRDWVIRIVIPNLLKFTEGSLVLILSYVLIIQTDNVITIFLDLTVMQLISELDNVTFWLATHGYFGSAFKEDATAAKKVQVRDEIRKVFGFPLRPLILVAIMFVLLSSFVSFVIGQTSGRYFYLEFPYCDIDKTQIVNIGNHKCDGGIYNVFKCGFDGGDCREFNLGYPNCDATHPFTVGDGKCDQENNVPQCLFDGGDCCAVDKNDSFFKDGNCNGGFYNTRVCKYDKGDCDEFRLKYSECPDYPLDAPQVDPFIIGDGNCDFVPHYMTKECGYEDGDCKDCIVPDANLLGNGRCDGGEYNTVACGFDAGDCVQCNELVEDISLIGDGFCNGGKYADDVCNDDGGDCFGCSVPNMSLVGDGFCHGGAYMSTSCSNDGGDCEGCKVDDPFLIGNGFCDGPKYSSDQCSNDGGDCEGCNVDDMSRLGNGLCDGGQYNTEACGYDSGDCLECNSNENVVVNNLGNGRCQVGYFASHITSDCNYDGGDCTGCIVEQPTLLRDGNCNGGDYDTYACRFDGGDCLEHRFPECKGIYDRLADRICDAPNNNPKCGWDGGDCIDHNSKLKEEYSECDSSKIHFLGNGYCNKSTNTFNCGWDDGDCKEFNDKFPNCKVLNPFKIGDGKCDFILWDYNTYDCGWDGGDCLERNEQLKERYPDCPKLGDEDFPYLGDHYCDSMMNIEICGWDGGDCSEFNDKYPNCTAEKPEYVGDKYYCDPYYNTSECGWDGGDCLL